jgi:hypothetical protein
MRVVKHTVFAVSLIGAAVALSGANPASAASLAPAFAQTPEAAAVQDVRHRWEHRPGRLQGERYWQPKNAPHNHRYGPTFRRSGPTVGFGLSVPGLSFGIGVPRHYGTYGHARPYGYGYGYRGW